jgi:uncharacterized membrane protein
MKFSLFMSSTAGRLLRVVAGAALIVVGILLQSVLGVVIAIVGVVVLLAGVLNVCLIAPILRQPFAGRNIRARAAKKTQA